MSSPNKLPLIHDEDDMCGRRGVRQSRHRQTVDDDEGARPPRAVAAASSSAHVARARPTHASLHDENKKHGGHQEQEKESKWVEPKTAPAPAMAGAFAVSPVRGEIPRAFYQSTDSLQVDSSTESREMPPPTSHGNQLQAGEPVAVVAHVAEPTAEAERMQEEIAYLRSEVQGLHKMVPPVAEAQVAHVVVAHAEDNENPLPQEQGAGKQRRKLFIALGIALLAAIGIALGVVVAVTKKDNDGPPEDTLPPVPPLTLSPTTTPGTPVVSGEWLQAGQILNGATAQDLFGQSVQLSRDGAVMAVGAQQDDTRPGYVSVFRYDRTLDIAVWTPMGQSLVGDVADDRFGGSISLNFDGTILAVGALQNDAGGDQAGHVQVYQYNTAIDTWMQRGSDIEGDTSMLLGTSLSLSDDGDVLAVGAPLHTTSNGLTGSVQMFKYNTVLSSWEQHGQGSLDGLVDGEAFGVSLSLSGDGAVVGVTAWGFNADANPVRGSVAAYEFDPVSSLWSPLGNPIKGEDSDPWITPTVSLDDSGLTMAVGVPGDSDHSTSIGRVEVYAYNRATSNWTQQGEGLETQQPGDQFGRSVSLSHRGDVLAVGSWKHDVNGLDSAGQVGIFLFNKDTEEWRQVGDRLNGTSAFDSFGASVSLSPDGAAVAVGANTRDANGRNSGSAYAYFIKDGTSALTRSPTTSPPITSRPATVRPTPSPPDTRPPTSTPVSDSSWKQLGQVLHGKLSRDYFGASVSLSSDASVLAVGASQWNVTKQGYVSVFQLNQAGQEWLKIGQDIVGEADGDWFGDATSLNGDGTVLAVGSWANDGETGYVRVYEYSTAAGRWVQLGRDIDGEGTVDRFGVSVALSDAGDMLAVGALFDTTDNGFSSGSARLFQYNRGMSSWEQLGQTINGQGAYDYFGVSVSLNGDGTIVAIGSRENDAGARNAGHVSLYEYNSATSMWVQMGGTINGEVSDGWFGMHVSLDERGLLVAVGAPNDFVDDETLTGRVYVYAYDRASSAWKQRGQTLMGQHQGSIFGNALSLSGNGNILAVGDTWYKVNGLSFVGQVGIFRYDTDLTEWTQIGERLNGKSQYDQFGWSVALSADGSVVAVGAIDGDENGINSGSAYVYTVN